MLSQFGTSGNGPLLDPKLLLGAVLFGAGWGTLGICPGPSVVGLSLPLVGADAPWRFPCFVLSSIAGMELAETAMPTAMPMAMPSIKGGKATLGVYVASRTAGPMM